MARDFKFNGIKYCDVDENAKTCRASERKNVDSIVILPELVYDFNTIYTLVEICDYLFVDCEIKSIIIPENVKRIENSAFVGTTP